MPGYRCVMFWRSQNQGGNSCHQTRTAPTTIPRAKHPLILSHYVESYQPHRSNSSCMGTAFSSSAAAQTSRCLSPRCGQLNASCAKFCKRCMKAASRSSRPGLTKESLFRKRGKSQMGSEVNENSMKGYVCQVGSTRLESVHPLSKHQTVESCQVPLHY